MQLFLFILFSVIASAQVSTISQKVHTFENKDCEKTNSCDLKSLEIKVRQYRISLDGDPIGNLGTSMVAKFQTQYVSDLENYGIAQFVQGCQYISKKENGVINNYGTIMREYYGKIIPYFHPQMALDGFVSDPLAWGKDASKPRHHYYITKDPSRNYTGDDYYGNGLPKNPILYLVDHPGVAGYYPSQMRAYNISMKFKTCIYKSAAVPKVVDPLSINFAKPIHCVEWASSYVYNFEKKKFETLPEITPYCLALNNKSPLDGGRPVH